MSEFVQYLVTGLGTGCAVALVGSGLVAIYRVTRVVNFAQGSFAVLAAMIASSLLAMGLPHGFAELLATAAGACIGALVGLVAIGKPGTSPSASLIVTLGIAIFVYAVEVLVWGDQPRSYAGVPGAVEVLGARFQAHYVAIIGATVVVFAAMAAFFARTDIGRALTACAANPYAARVVGIDVTRMGFVAFAIGGGLGGLAGVLVTPVQQVTFDTDVTLIVGGFAAAIVGGLTRPLLTLAGGLLLGVAEAMVAGYGSAAHQTEVALVIILAVMIFQSARRPTVQRETV